MGYAPAASLFAVSLTHHCEARDDAMGAGNRGGAVKLVCCDGRKESEYVG